MNRGEEKEASRGGGEGGGGEERRMYIRVDERRCTLIFRAA